MYENTIESVKKVIPCFCDIWMKGEFRKLNPFFLVCPVLVCVSSQIGSELIE